MRFAAVDFGGSFIKSAVVDTTTAQLRSLRRSSVPPFIAGLRPSWREIDLQHLRREFHEHVDAALAADPSCAGVLVSTQMHGFALVDQSGKAASNFISWQDQRSLDGNLFGELSNMIGPERRARVGGEVGPGHAASVLFTLARSDNRLRKGLVPLPLPNAIITADYGSEPAADATLASSFGTWDVARGAWDRDVIERLELDAFDWPRVTRCTDIVGDYVAGGIRRPIYSPIGDQQAALAGSLLARGELSLNIGTGSQVSVLASEHRSGPFKARPWLGAGFLETVTHIPAGRALNALMRMLGRKEEPEAQTWLSIDEALSATVETDLVLDTSFFPSAFGDRGRIENLHEGNMTPGHLFLAAFQSMAANYEAAAKRLFPACNWGPLVFSGGLAHRSARLREITATRLQRPYRLSPFAEETLAGLACVGRVIEGSESTVDEAAASLRALKN